MLNNILDLSKKFISIKSTLDNHIALNEILELALTDLKEFTIEKFERNGVKSALVYNTQKRPNKFKVILNGHLDIIPGKDNQYIPTIKNNRLYGVGSMDMKANVACLITVFKEIASKVNYPLALQLVTDEEIGGFNGTKYQIEKGVKADFVITGETTNFDIVNKAKGVLWIKISAQGKTAHGAYPWRGKNAIWKIIKFLNLLEKKYPLPTQQAWETTVNVSKIETTNQTFNKIPDNCELWLDIRFIPEEKNIISKLKTMLPRGYKLDIITNEPALFVDQQNSYLKLLQRISKEVTKGKVSFYGAQGSSDARHFTRINTPGVEFGPIGGGIGTDNEWVDIKSLGKYSEILKNFLLEATKIN